MKPRHYLSSLLLLLYFPLSAQVSPSSLSKGNVPDTDSNFEHSFEDGFIGVGFVLGSQHTGSTVKLGESREFIAGFGLGYKFCRYNGIGLDIYYKSTGFYLAQDSTKVLPNSTPHQSEKIAFNNFGGLIFNRFYLGSVFLDAGFYYDWAFYTKDVTWDASTVQYSSTTRTVNRQLAFTNGANYGLTFRLGKVQGISLYFSYRFSKVFDQNYNSSQLPPNQQGVATITPYPELPPFVLGIVIGNH